jgi:hypothetical protein
MSEHTKQPLDAAIGETMDQANQAIAQTRAEIARKR